jgi:hypothetical protein
MTTPRWVTISSSVLAGWIVYAYANENIPWHSAKLLYAFGLSTHTNECPVIIVRIIAAGIALFLGYLAGMRVWATLSRKSLFIDYVILVLLVALFLLFNLRYSQECIYPST